MHIVLSIFLLTLPSATIGFTGQTLPTSRRARNELNGRVGDFFEDRFDDTASILKRFQNKFVKQAREDGADFNEQLDIAERVDWEVKDDGFFGYIPEKGMTGVEPHMTRLCATLSLQLYQMKAKEEFQLTTKDHKTELLIYDNHGGLNSATIPFGIAVCGDTMILGWRGTSQLLDGINDFAASPQSSFAWRKHAATIKIQGAITSIAQNDLVTHEAYIIEEAKKRGIKEIVTTGHSLGGATAQVAHLTLRAQIQDRFSPWAKLKGINIRSVAFSAPMTTVLLDNASPETDDFVEELAANSCNMFFHNDIIPRGYGYLNFIEDYVDNVVESGALTKKVPLPKMVKRLFDMREKLEGIVDDVLDNDSLNDLLKVASQYMHIGHQIYYESEDAKPRVLIDMGAFYKNPLGKKDILRDVKYKPVPTPIEDTNPWHMSIIKPGLGYSNNDLSKK